MSTHTIRPELSHVRARHTRGFVRIRPDTLCGRGGFVWLPWRWVNNNLPVTAVRDDDASSEGKHLYSVQNKSE